MNSHAEQLRCAATEVLAYFERNRSSLASDEQRWRELARQMTEAAQLTDERKAEGAVNGIARFLIDEFPLNSEFSPAFQGVLGAVQRAGKRRTRGSR